MLFRFGKEKPLEYLNLQLRAFFPLNKQIDELIKKHYNLTLERTKLCFSSNSNKYYYKYLDNSRHTYFDPLHTCQWFIFLYLFANSIYKYEENMESRVVCDQLYFLSKICSGADLYYEVDMPDFFACDHPVGSVIGRAHYSNGFSFTQGCTVGNNHGFYPYLEENVKMLANSTIIGKSHIGKNSIISANTYIKDQNIPENSIVFGMSPNLVIKYNH